MGKDIPPKGPLPPKKSRKTSSGNKLRRESSKNKFNLNPVQRVQVEIIDGKRCAVRACLLISYVTLLHILGYLVVLAHAYPIIRRSKWLCFAFYGFFLDLGLYFFGSGAVLKAITYSWLPLKFCLGITAIVLGMVLNVLLFFLGTVPMHKSKTNLFSVYLPVNDCLVLLADDEDRNYVCTNNKTLMEIALLLMPFILPPISFICALCATMSAYMAVYLTPQKLRKGQVDAVWLEPYETYDFYVGKIIPRNPGDDDDKFNEVPTSLSQYLDGDDEDDVEAATTDNVVSG